MAALRGHMDHPEQHMARIEGLFEDFTVRGRQSAAKCITATRVSILAVPFFHCVACNRPGFPPRTNAPSDIAGKPWCRCLTLPRFVRDRTGGGTLRDVKTVEPVMGTSPAREG